ncbi:unnamed protein product [Rotaria socialis]|uniref:Retrotransposon gag domain-containing protein n=1 Tax=Rotaria socialis TaxID=392032 RepID=A0A820IIM3_9BILA|nr:unnamed protein product [Rotaria socialis]CAF4311742.1 unnamed protein product [Rotaria socialis]
MPIEGTNLENLLERALFSTPLLLQSSTTPLLLQSSTTPLLLQSSTTPLLLQSSTTPLLLQSSTTPPLHSSTDTPSRSVNKINVKLKEYNGTSEENYKSIMFLPCENVITWLIALEEIMKNRCIVDDEKISLAVSLLGGTASQWFVNLKLKNQGPSS